MEEVFSISWPAGHYYELCRLRQAQPPEPKSAMLEKPEFVEILSSLLARRELGEPQIRAFIGNILQGRHDEVETATLLIALRMKGETAREVAAAARLLREHMIRWDPGIDGVLDTCGTGGDGSCTFNISTATAFVVAGAGVPVVKHGNLAVSSRSGSADVLAALGVCCERDPAHARHCLHAAGLAFCFAPHFHPALAHVASLRRRLAVPTIFNCLGPLANPAGAAHQLLGVGRSDLLDVIAGALAQLGAANALVVHGGDGLDEVSLAAPTQVRQVRDGAVSAWQWTADDFGLPTSPSDGLRAANALDSARIMERVLHGEAGPATDVVVANAGAALIAAGRVDGPTQGVTAARAALESGRALHVLEVLRKLKRS
jgi:anthranilate phosphoribosyltransferase